MISENPEITINVTGVAGVGKTTAVSLILHVLKAHGFPVDLSERVELDLSRCFDNAEQGVKVKNIQLTWPRIKIDEADVGRKYIEARNEINAFRCECGYNYKCNGCGELYHGER